MLRASGAARTISADCRQQDRVAERFIAGTDPPRRWASWALGGGVAASKPVGRGVPQSRTQTATGSAFTRADWYPGRQHNRLARTESDRERSSLSRCRGKRVDKLSSFDPSSTRPISRHGQRPEEPCCRSSKPPATPVAAINFDMERNRLKELTLEVFERCGEIAFPAGIAPAYSAARGRRPALIAWARHRQAGDGAADQRLIGTMNRPAERWAGRCRCGRKAATDACFERVAEIISLHAARGEGASPGGGVRTTSLDRPISLCSNTTTAAEPSSSDALRHGGGGENAALPRSSGSAVRALGRDFRAWPTWSAGCWRTRRTSRGSARGFPSSSIRCSFWRRPIEPPRRRNRPKTVSSTGPPGGTTSARRWNHSALGSRF